MTGRFRLLDDFQAKYIKFQGREPRTLRELAIARADLEHRRRLAEIKVIAKKLELLDEFLPALAERGIKLAERSFSTWDQGKTLRIQDRMFGDDHALLEALLALGFKEVERKDSFRDEQTVTVRHGRWLMLSMTLKKKPAGSAA